MPNKATSFKDLVQDDSSTVGEKISDTATQVKDKVSDLGHTAADKIDENRDAAAVGLDKAAATLHEKAESLPGGEKVASLAHATAAIVMPSWAAALIVGAALAVVATLMLTTGLKRFKQIHPTPERTVETIKENVEWAKQQAK